MIKLIKKRLTFFVGSFIIFGIIHLIITTLTIALMSGWHDVNIIGTLLGVLLYALIPFLFFGKSVAFLGLWIYFISAFFWAIILSTLNTYLFEKYKEKKNHEKQRGTDLKY